MHLNATLSVLLLVVVVSGAPSSSRRPPPPRRWGPRSLEEFERTGKRPGPPPRAGPASRERWEKDHAAFPDPTNEDLKRLSSPHPHPHSNPPRLHGWGPRSLEEFEQTGERPGPPPHAGPASAERWEKDHADLPLPSKEDLKRLSSPHPHPSSHGPKPHGWGSRSLEEFEQIGSRPGPPPHAGPKSAERWETEHADLPLPSKEDLKRLSSPHPHPHSPPPKPHGWGPRSLEQFEETGERPTPSKEMGPKSAERWEKDHADLPLPGVDDLKWLSSPHPHPHSPPPKPHGWGPRSLEQFEETGKRPTPPKEMGPASAERWAEDHADLPLPSEN